MLQRLPRAVVRRARIKKSQVRDRIHGFIDSTYFNERKDLTEEKRKIRFHCVAWGDYLESFLGYTVPSLLQDGNAPALVRDGYDLELDLYAHPHEYQEISKKYDSCLARLDQYMLVNLKPFDELQSGSWRGNYWLSALIDQIKRCIDESSTMFMTGPDTVFGNHSIANAVRMVQGKNVCLASATPRVAKSILTSDAFTGLRTMDRVVENDELVDLAFEHGEPSLREFFDDKDSNMTHGGLSIRELNHGTYSVIHNEPVTHLAYFVRDDLRFFVSSGSNWYRYWPRLLFRQNRLKVVGSSDVFFSVELTNKAQSNPGLRSGLLYNDKFLGLKRKFLQQYVYNSFFCVWRGKANKAQDSVDAVSSD